MKRIIFAVIVAIAFSACQESLEDRCAREAKEYTKKKCPARADQFTTIDSLVFERSTHTMHYYYTLSGQADNRVRVQHSNPKEVLIWQVRNSTSLKDYKDNGYNFAYTYFSAKQRGTVLFSTVITPKEYR